MSGHGEFLDNGGGGGGGRAVMDVPYHTAPIAYVDLSQPRLNSLSVPNYTFSSPGLSLGLTNMGGQGEMMNRMGPGAGFDSPGRNKDEEYESRSGSDNVEGGSGDDVDHENNPPGERRRYHRHTPQQIQELEALFKECPHPDEKQRLELSRRLNLDSRQVKFWFQNRRTQMKTQLERHENAILRQENDRLKAENLSIRDAMRNPMCSNCGGPAVLGELSLEEQHLRIENARLKDELERVCTLAAKFLGRPISSLGSPASSGMPNSALELAVGVNSCFNNPVAAAITTTTTSTTITTATIKSTAATLPPASNVLNGMGSQVGSSIDRSLERSTYLEIALAAMDELVRMVQVGEPLWLSSPGGGKEVLNHEEYSRAFSRARSVGLVSEATRDSGMVIINSLALVETLMDANRWVDMFHNIVARASTTDVISNGVAGTRNGALQLMRAELQVLSPLVPIREINFLRFCKQHAEGVWAVVDVSVDGIRDSSSATPLGYMGCRRLPSGCVVQDSPNGYSKVTWLEHAEYDETPVHQHYRSALRSGMGFGASRWVATLRRQCECLAILRSPTVPSRDHTAITPAGRGSIMRLAQRMTDNFCAGVCPSTVHKWSRLSMGTIDEDVRVMARKSVDNPGEPPGVVLGAATSVWLPVMPQRLFDFLRDEHLRSEWDILSNGAPMQEVAHIAKGQDPGNCISLLRASAPGTNQSSMLILQETSTDASGSLVVYAPVDVPDMHAVMSGGDSSCVSLLPSGFSIIPDRAPQQSGPFTDEGRSNSDPSPSPSAGGSRLTVAFQILVNSLPTATLTVESVVTVKSLISCTVQKIKASLRCEN